MDNKRLTIIAKEFDLFIEESKIYKTGFIRKGKIYRIEREQ